MNETLMAELSAAAATRAAALARIKKEAEVREYWDGRVKRGAVWEAKARADLEVANATIARISVQLAAPAPAAVAKK